MLKRLVMGLVKGVLIGGAVGAGLHFGLGWTIASGLLGYLLAMGAGATAGILVGKPPWKQAAWIESLLKAVAGLGVGALIYWVSSKWGSFELPFAIPGVESGTAWTEVPLLFVTAVSAVFGTLIELDNTDEDEPERGTRTKVRVSDASVVEEAELMLDGGAEQGL